ncbi:NUDIX hydrolase [Arenimonas maotaiensis]|uniref:NUDIX hydrolase n=1 Tax=Arenimonas maotaiensis TaxID=1446479 RepID=A0A917FPZ3_9GAMM|nr:NUDIX hydrolase [Arenimonas maotaiensis]GGF96701.1 NUDIX hydrolase [Arenimonas maotaiensis]
MLDAIQRKLLESLAQYRPEDPGQNALRADFAAFVIAHPACCERSLAHGHLTGSAWLVSADGRRALLMHHRKLDRWLQPGGHADGDADLAAVALREAGEETGLAGLVCEGGIFDLDRHQIPARGTEPAHWHYDLRFVVRAADGEDFSQNAESLALAWFDIAELAERPDLDESLRRMARRWLAHRSPAA